MDKIGLATWLLVILAGFVTVRVCSRQVKKIVIGIGVIMLGFKIFIL